MRLDELTVAHFEPHVGEGFAVGSPEPIELVLDSATTLGDRPGGRDPFSLMFRGPAAPLLPQAVYAIQHAALGTLEIFIVPLGQDSGGTRYEVIFA